ncbi:MAG: NAD(P)/FAD-dependent oxidoreductase [Patescibacteria group bacterium]|nr:NAD(P)/FAD-dependent oxidoreductase [Patescibacteria group bacterium]
MTYDVVIVGASFAGLTLAHHLPKDLRVLLVDIKPEPGSTVESTGLITTKTYLEFKSFLDIDHYITNPISAICVVAPSFDDYFVSSVAEPWIYQTDTKALVKAMAETVPANVEIRMKTAFLGLVEGDTTKIRIRSNSSAEEVIETKVLIGADGSHSKVAAEIPELSQNDRFLFGYEQVFFGSVNLDERPAETIYHFWFGEFSLGYGGWLSPTIIDGRPAFRVGLAKLEKDRAQAKELTQEFVELLLNKKIISIEGAVEKPGYIFGSLIPINGVRKHLTYKNTLLIGDAAGFCGAFAADGIKGAVVSGKESAKLVEQFLAGDRQALSLLPQAMNQHGGLIKYYAKQMKYRWIWDRMKSNRTFTAMYSIIKAERATFLNQFCDSKDKHQSLAWTVLKFKYLPKLIKYSCFIMLDFFKRS